MQGILATHGPLVVLGLGAVVAMLLGPRRDRLHARVAAAVTLALAAALTLFRLGMPAVAVTELLVDDGLARFGTLVVCLSGLAGLVFLRPALPAREAPALTLLAALGAAVLCGATHAATVFLGLELVTLSLIAMFVLPLTRPALEAGYKFLILGAAGGATLLFAFALAYAATGRLGLDAWAGGGMLVALGAALLLAGLAFKFALVPFHMWTPDAFSGAPAAAAAFAGVASKMAVAVVLVRLAAVGPPDPVWHSGLAAMGVGSILLGNLAALRQTSLTRMLGYSSVAHSGYMAVVLASGAALGPEAVLFYLAAYAPALLAALCVAALLGDAPGLDDLRGLAWRQPLAGAGLALGLMSLAGLPVAAGFLGKFYLFAALIQAQAWGLLAVTAAGAALGFYYYLRFFAVIFRRGSGDVAAEVHWSDGAVLIGCAAIILVVGVYPEPLVELVRQALN
ncbi:proton-conducting transporter membrane subunit [Paracoccaceae bacterium Fryx2]|nr:proton-conducting transporter membrane subunit [Paracoccaceae bacterium Fryx2]